MAFGRLEECAGEQRGDVSVSEPALRDRVRDAFPLPYVYTGSNASVLALANFAIRGLNALYGTNTPSPSLRLIPCQLGVLENILQKCTWLFESFGECETLPSGDEALDILVGPTLATAIGGPVGLRADAFDLLESSGKVDAQRHLPEEHHPEGVRDRLFRGSRKHQMQVIEEFILNCP